MGSGYLGLVLHAHLPYSGTSTRGDRREEQWFHECARECYLPLIRILDQLNRDGVSGRITLSISPTLIATMRDPLVGERLLEHLDQMIELSAREMNRTALDPDLKALTGTYHLRLLQIRNALDLRCGGNLLRALADLQACGRVELITSAASHALLPVLAAMQPQAARCQVRLGLDTFAEAFGFLPPGFWLPECAYSPQLDELLGTEGVGYTVVDGLGIQEASTPAVHGVHAPVFGPSGVAVFGRDREATCMWWCDATGRPTVDAFRDNARDIAWELPLDYLRPHVSDDGPPTATGFRYHRIGGSNGNGRPNHYERKRALDHAAEISHAFMRSLQDRAEARTNGMDRPPMFVAAYDLHRFGQAWFEGPEFLDYLFRKIHYDQGVLEMITPTDYLRRHPCNQMTVPSLSSWGEGGHFQEWVGKENAWVYRHLARAARVMHHLTLDDGPRATAAGGDGNGNEPLTLDDEDTTWTDRGLTETSDSGEPSPGPIRSGTIRGGREVARDVEWRSRAMQVAGRQLLLAQAGDWVSMMRDEHRAEYGRHRLVLHLRNFSRVASQIDARCIDTAEIEALEREWPIFERIPIDAYQ